MVKVFPAGTRERFVDLVCEGHGLRAAGVQVGASINTATTWWRQSGAMSIRVGPGERGLVDRPPAGDEPVGRALSRADRAVIALGRKVGMSYAQIGAEIGRDKSVVFREVSRNSSPDGVYYGSLAHAKAHQRRRRPKVFKLRRNPQLCRRIEAWMDEGWSPRLIAQTLKIEGCGNTERVSHETIYQALYVQGRGHLRADLHRQLSTHRPRRRTRGRAAKSGPSPYKGAFTISERPPEADDRAVPGHWEGDLIVGPYSRSAIGTLVERSTRFTMLLHLPGGHTAAEVAEAMIAEMSQLPEHLRRSITWDRGSELADYARIQMQLSTKVFFCDPHSPWQRGSNENTNRLLRHWFPKGDDLSRFSVEDLRRAQDSLNARPRPTLDMQTPAIRLNTLLNRAA